MGKIKVTQVRSPIGRRADQRETLIGLAPTSARP
nr:uL30 family ribosomal protein [Geminicoccus flavidas]